MNKIEMAMELETSSKETKDSIESAQKKRDPAERSDSNFSGVNVYFFFRTSPAAQADAATVTDPDPQPRNSVSINDFHFQ